MNLRTERLVLEPFALGDVEPLHRLWTDPDVRRYLWDDVIIPRSRAAEVVEESIEGFGSVGFGLWTLRPEAGAEMLGFAGLRRFDDPPEVEILYGLAPAWWHRGLATEAGRAVLRFGFDDAGLERIWGRTDVPNEASQRVLERLGMRFVRRRLVGVLDTVEYAIARAEFSPGS